jgi:hypothetical protein
MVGSEQIPRELVREVHMPLRASQIKIEMQISLDNTSMFLTPAFGGVGGERIFGKLRHALSDAIMAPDAASISIA